jgi:hypothetical protein
MVIVTVTIKGMRMDTEKKRPGRPPSGQPMAGRTRTMLYRHRKQAEITASIGNESRSYAATLLERLKRDLSVLDHDPSASREIASKVIHEFCRRYGIDPNHS